jgi:hypothetical protein
MNLGPLMRTEAVEPRKLVSIAVNATRQLVAVAADGSFWTMEERCFEGRAQLVWVETKLRFVRDVKD